MISHRRNIQTSNDEAFKEQETLKQARKTRKTTRAISPVSVISLIILLAVMIWRSQSSERRSESDRENTNSTARISAKVNIQRQGSDLMKVFTDEETNVNSHLIQLWRQRYMTECKKYNTHEYLHNKTGGLFSPPPPEALNHITASQDVVPCQHTFLDLGANIGDTVGHVVDAGLPFCGDEKMGLHPKYDMDLGTLNDPYRVRRWNPISNWFHRHLANFSEPALYPEHFCVFSFEGNPLFTSRQIERRGSIPRPVRRTLFVCRGRSVSLSLLFMI